MISVTGIQNLAAFRAVWLKTMWTAMQKTGNGYPRPKQKRETRREDKQQAARQGLSNKMRAALAHLGR